MPTVHKVVIIKVNSGYVEEYKIWNPIVYWCPVLFFNIEIVMQKTKKTLWMSIGDVKLLTSTVFVLLLMTRSDAEHYIEDEWMNGYGHANS